MLDDLKIGRRYDGFLYLADAARNPPTLRSHHHVELEVNLVVRGTITYLVGGRRFTFPQRTILWMFPAQEHQLIDRSKDAQYYIAVFKPALIRRSCHAEAYAGLKRRNVDGDGVLHTRLDPAAFDLIRGTMDSLMEGALDADTLNREAGFGVSADFRFEHGDPDALNAGLHHLLLLCWRSQRGRHTTEEAVALHPAVRKAVDLLAGSDGDQNLGQLARRCGVSEAYLSRVFAKEVGVPLSRYRNRLRLSRFLELYRAPVRRTVTEAVYAAGFGSYAQFYKVFAQTYGCGPRAGLRPAKSDKA